MLGNNTSACKTEVSKKYYNSIIFLYLIFLRGLHPIIKKEEKTSCDEFLMGREGHELCAAKYYATSLTDRIHSRKS